MPNVEGFEEQIAGWTFEERKSCLMNDTGKNSIGVLFRRYKPNTIHEISRRTFWRSSGRWKTAEQCTKFHEVLASVMLDQRWATGLYPKEVLSKGQLEFATDGKRVSSQPWTL